MNTQKLMDLALEMAGLDKMPNDCGIIVPGENIKKVLMGVDMDTAELLLAKQMGYDCVVSHHPKNTHPEMLDVMDNHVRYLVNLGVPKNEAQKALAKQKETLSYHMHVSNSRRSESAAQLLNMPYVSLHSPADVITQKTVQEFLDTKFKDNPDVKLGDITEALEEIGEYKNSSRKPVIRVGSKDSYAGKIFVSMAGFTGPGVGVLKKYFEAGVGTLIVMHIPEADAKALQEHNMGNVIVAGHMSSDSIGMNKLAEKWREQGIEVTLTSGVVSGEL